MKRKNYNLMIGGAITLFFLAVALIGQFWTPYGMTLADLKIGQDAVLRTIGGQGELRHHLLDMGLTPGTEVTLRKVAPMGDPIEVELRGYELTLRLADAAKIEVENVHETDRAARSE